MATHTINNVKIQLRHDTAQNWQTKNPKLAVGELGIETDTQKAKIGDGTTTWNSLPYAWGGGVVPAITTGSSNGTISVGGTDVAVKGLGSAAYTESTDYLTAHQTIKQDGITGATVNRYGACSTAAATARKAVAVTTGTVSLEAGLRITVKFANANTANTPTLKVGSNAAKNIFHKGAQITTGGNKALLSGVCDFIYDGTQFHLVGNYIDTVYTHPTTAGNKHIPADGSAGQFLKYSSAGTAAWTNITGADAKLTGYTKASSASAIAATDTVNEAIGKLEKRLEPNFAVSLQDPGTSVWIEVPVENIVVGAATPTDTNALWLETTA